MAFVKYPTIIEHQVRVLQKKINKKMKYSTYAIIGKTFSDSHIFVSFTTTEQCKITTQDFFFPSSELVNQRSMDFQYK